MVLCKDVTDATMKFRSYDDSLGAGSKGDLDIRFYLHVDGMHMGGGGHAPVTAAASMASGGGAHAISLSPLEEISFACVKKM